MSAAEQRVDRYELIGELATGGMATVYLGRQHGPFGFARTVAIKSMHPQYAKDAGFRAMFLDEATLTARIRHPNVVPTLDIVAADDNVLLVMEYIEGVALATLLRRAFAQSPKISVSPAIASAVLCDALHGLHAAHILQDDDGAPLHVVHRDVSPQNIHVGTDGLGRVLDFGVAKAATRRYVTVSGEVKGKLAYMSKEQLCGEAVDHRTDVYAAGVVLWEMLTGRRLINAANEGAVVKKVLEASFEAPSNFTDAPLPPALDHVVMKALAGEANDRWASADEMADALALAMPPAPRNVVAAFVKELGAAEIDSRAHRLRLGNTGRSSRSSTPNAIVPPEATALAEILTEHATATMGPTVRTQITEVSLPPPAALAMQRRGLTLTLALVGGGALLVLALVGSAFLVGARAGRGKESKPPVTAMEPAPSISVSVAAAPPPPPPPPPTTEVTASSAPVVPPKPGTVKKPPKKPDCRVPYTINAQGDKNWRPECVQ